MVDAECRVQELKIKQMTKKELNLTDSSRINGSDVNLTESGITWTMSLWLLLWEIISVALSGKTRPLWLSPFLWLGSCTA